jgi:hypothetical protein
MITENLGSYMLIAGVISVIISFSKPGKFWYIFLIVGATFIVMRLKMKNVMILKDYETKYKYLTYKDSIKYNLRNGEQHNYVIKENTIINDSRFELKIEKVGYGYGSLASDETKIVDVISPYSSVNLKYEVDYIYETPPNSIKVKGGGSFVKLWLHK